MHKADSIFSPCPLEGTIKKKSHPAEAGWDKHLDKKSLLLATTQDERETTEAEKGCGGWLWDSGRDGHTAST